MEKDTMITVTVSDAALRQAAEEGMDEFVKVFIDGIQKAIGGQLTNENMARLNADQITLLGWLCAAYLQRAGRIYLQKPLCPHDARMGTARPLLPSAAMQEVVHSVS